MKISGINQTSVPLGQMNAAKSADPVSKDIQRQIADAQKQMQELSSNQEMSMEEKAKRRQEIQQQISDLNVQLRQHEMEQRKEKQQAKGTSMDDMLGGSGKARTGRKNEQGTGLSQAGMKAMISADAAIDQAQVQGSVASQMDGRAGVLKAEIKQDAALGGNTEAKEKELAEVEQLSSKATAMQMGTLGEADRQMKEAAETEAPEEKKEDTEKDAEKDAVNGEKDTKAARPAGNGEMQAAGGEQKTDVYIPIDVRV